MKRAFHIIATTIVTLLSLTGIGYGIWARWFMEQPPAVPYVTEYSSRAELCRSLRFLEIRSFDEDIQNACFNALADFRAQRVKEFWEQWERTPP